MREENKTELEELDKSILDILNKTKTYMTVLDIVECLNNSVSPEEVVKSLKRFFCDYKVMRIFKERTPYFILSEVYFELKEEQKKENEEMNSSITESQRDLIQEVSHYKEKFMNMAKGNLKYYELRNRYYDFSEEWNNYRSKLTKELWTRFDQWAITNSANEWTISPYIAGAIGQAIGGTGAGLYAAMSAADKKKEIEKRRIQASFDMIGAEINVKLSTNEVILVEKRLVKIAEAINGILDNFPEVKSYRIEQKRIKEEQERIKEEQERKREEEEKKRVKKIHIYSLSCGVIFCIFIGLELGNIGSSLFLAFMVIPMIECVYRICRCKSVKRE